ncbi:ABC transporter, ATP-binding protein [Klebsiella pneumoniae subsp. pneumoniae]|uniref:ABC transporter, ATP-binding protein n=1 Tax=Klebsiella pneumoniae subsp. pneumoniae TaxID=72407 RepID=A0A377ZUE0_KLEPN|nr:ABC transporter, ATP-binding protein [Klebsiella pneumoniae subsp. pneumoniae]
MNNAMIEFRHVSKSFSRKGHPVLALQDINLSIERGDIFGIIGYSGAGKSTLLRLINRLETPGEGKVLLNGEPLQACSGQRLQAIKKDIGMIFQNFNLLNSKPFSITSPSRLFYRGATRPLSRRGWRNCWRSSI